MTQIPWCDPSELNEARQFFMTLCRQRPHAFGGVRVLALEIRKQLEALDPVMDLLCSRTCPDCRDNCCARATVWYDFRDLLFLYFSPGDFPKVQISRCSGPVGRPVCVHLTGTGCTLPRVNRPFICTWYICGAQKGMAGEIVEQVARIKDLRQAMETDFMKACF